MPKPRLAPAPPPAFVAREDYRPPDWRVPEIALDVDIGADRVRVTARLEVVRAGDHGRPLRLDGTGLRLLSLKVDGKPAGHKLDKAGLTVRLAGDRAVVETIVEIVPGAAVQLGLFETGGVLCTQCEAEAFRRITFFPDRPDILSRFQVRIAADQARYPVLLSNGNPDGAGALENGRHWARWDDPVPKPCYAFALVAGDLAARRATFTTRAGRAVALGIWAAEADLAKAGHAMASLTAAMRWDEQAYGRDYDLAAFNIVILPGFALGAMENKGLNIFSSAVALLDPETATDADYDRVAALIGHEYFHNWSGNRVTCRDWFQLPLKEGFTVFRDQQFSASMGSAAVKRIEDVRALRAGQFPQDAGPLAHPVRPDRYRDVSDLYTATVYIKGAELVRMLRTIVGAEAFRAGADLYFDRHDGSAAACEDLVAAMEETGGVDLAGFQLWYAQAGTPRVRARLRHDPAARRAVLVLEQHLAAAPGRPAALPMPIPLAVALFGADGGKRGERLLLLRAARQEFVFDGVGEAPILSINRGFSAPVLVDAGRSAADLAFLAAHDDDPFARWEALQELMLAALVDAVEGRPPDHAPIVDAVRRTLADPGLDRGFVAEAVLVPDEAYVGARMALVDPGAIHAAVERLRAELGRALAPAWRAAQAAAGDDPVSGKGSRRLRSVALSYLLAGGVADAGAIALRQYRDADTMTDRQGALRALADSDAPERIAALADFHQRYRGHPDMLDMWFMAQALSRRDDTIETAPRLIAHPDFTVSRPTRLSALVGAFAANHHAFHDKSGRGYRFLADVALALDRLDPVAAAALVRPLSGWPRLEPKRAALMRQQRARIGAAPAVSPALSAQVSAPLAA